MKHGAKFGFLVFGAGILASIAFGLAMATVTTGCSKRQLGYEKMDIVSVWKHAAGKYSVSKMNGTEIVDVDFSRIPSSGCVCNIGKCTLLVDVPAGSNMWCEVYYRMEYGASFSYVTIHVRSPDDVNGAGWNHGKFGSGTTERVR